MGELQRQRKPNVRVCNCCAAAAAGTDAQQAQASKILADSRTSLCQILADCQDEASAQEK